MTSSSLGFMLLGIWLILSGVMPLAGIHFAHSGTILSVLMIVSGVFILMGSRRSSGRWWS